MNTTTSATPATNGSGLENAYRVSVIVHVAMMMSIVFYAVVVEVLKHSVQPAHSDVAMMKNIFLAVGIFLFVAMKILRGVMLDRAPGDTLDRLVGKLQRTALVTAWLGEVPAVLAIVLFVLGGARVDSYILLAMSAAIYIAYFPRYSMWKEWLGSAARTASA